ncbi:keratin, type I cytoskeletal 19-like [Pelobates cultripes]|uniref:Keratin, type I cytoskeletal 19-like n=1 Tax=Pelobates cultripes TaxID=61616 RepID=A0AAD1WFW8_PELCU|nr:keratin, type I cytoskeletal 19-like [Pelobates cultripes]
MRNDVECSPFEPVNRHYYTGVYYPKPYQHNSSPQFRSFNGVYHRINSKPHFNAHGGLDFSSNQFMSSHDPEEHVRPKHSHFNNTRWNGWHNDRLKEDTIRFNGNEAIQLNGKETMHLNGKETMRVLNNRLASYMTEVDSLKEHNAQLEKTIRDEYQKSQADSYPDYSEFYNIVGKIQTKISSVKTDNANLVQQIQSASLAAENFRNKYDEESRMKTTAEEDIYRMQRIVEAVQMESQTLDADIENLLQLIAHLNSEHEEEVNRLGVQLGVRVNVAMDVAPTMALTEALSEVREEYESLLERNLKEAEDIFRSTHSELEHRLFSGKEELQELKEEIIDLKHTAHAMEIKLQTQLQMKSVLETSLEETFENNSVQLTELQSDIDTLQSQLEDVLVYMKDQDEKYGILSDQKTFLEMEIASYRHLIEGSGYV